LKLPNTFKVIWWIFLILVIGNFLYQRYPALVAGHAAPADVFVFFVLVALCLAPIFQEMSFFGLKFKQEIKSLKDHFDTQLAVLKTDIRNSIDFRPQITFPLPPPAPDAQLPNLEKVVQSAVGATLEKYGIKPTAAPDLTTLAKIDDNVSFLIAARYHIERLLNQIAGIRATERRGYPVGRLIRDIIEHQLLDPRLAEAISEVYNVCSLAVHGREVTKAQVSFVRDTAPGLIKALQAIAGETSQSD
jgi:hypothetical protein